MSKLIAEAITEAMGERCPDFDADCLCCKTWAEYDALSQARAEGRREGQIAERERMRRKEMRRAVTWLHGFAAQMNDPHAKQVINLAADEYGRETATAIRALSQKEGGKDG